MLPTVSVIIPTYNNVDVVVDAVESALAQTYAHKEVIVVDDGSTDETTTALQRYTDRVRIVQQANAGPGAARNRGVATSRGELIAFLDADDLWLPGKLEAQARFMQEHPDVHVVYHDWHVVALHSAESEAFAVSTRCPNCTLASEEIRSEVQWLYNELLIESVLCTDTVMIRRALFDHLGGFDTNLPQGQDYDLWLRASRESRIGRLDEKLAVVRIRPRSITTTPRSENYRARILQRALDHWGTIGPDDRRTDERVIRNVLARIWFDFGYGHLTNGSRRIARDAFAQSIRFRHSDAKAWINLLRTYL